MMVGGHRHASHLVVMRDRKIEQEMLLPLWVSKVDPCMVTSETCIK